MKTNTPKRRGFTLVELLVVIVIIASLAGLTAPMVIRQRKKADQTEATNNARQIGLAFVEFDNDYGSYPDANTLATINTSFTTASVTGAAANDSNGYFRQLFHAGLTQSEDMFYAKAAGTIKPDGDIRTNAQALAPGEVGFGYIMNGTVGLSSAGNPSRIVVATPLTQGAANTFDGDPFDRKAVVLRIDNSVKSINIRTAAGDNTNQGPAIVAGQSILAAGNPMWGNVTPTIMAPLPKN